MPISKEEFEKGKKKNPLEEKIVDFLMKNKDATFTDPEIADNVGIEPVDLSKGWKTNATKFFGWLGFYSTLNRLVREGKIKKKRINHEEYYSA